MTSRQLDTEITNITARQGNIVFDSERTNFTFVAVDYDNGWQCYIAAPGLDAEQALRTGILLPVRSARVVFPGRRGQPYYYADRRV